MLKQAPYGGSLLFFYVLLYMCSAVKVYYNRIR